jgi:diguanylate cyclase
MPKKQASQKNADLRRRYIRQGDELDALKERYNEHVELLQRLVSRLSLVSDDNDKALLKEVSTLRRQLKGEDTVLEQLSGSLTRIDKLLLDQKRSAVKRSKSLDQKLSDKTAVRRQKNDNAWHRLKGRLGLAFSGSKEDSADLIDDLGVVEELPATEELKRVLEATPGYGVIARKVSETLNTLLSQLTFPESAQRELQALRLRISSRVNWYELPPTLEDLSNLVLASVGKGQRQFDTFLVDLDEQLRKIQEFLSEQGQHDESWKALNQKLTSLIQSQNEDLAKEFEQRPEGSEDNAEVKQSIVEHVSRIADVTGEALKQGESLSEQFKPQLEGLRERLQSMDSEQKDLREQLKTERKKTLTDVLTGLPSREAFDERLEFEFSRWQRDKTSALLVAAGVDNFSEINERFGHLSGDRALQIVAKEIKQRIRKTDFIARHGGEEFVFILPTTELESGAEIIEKLRKVTERLPFHFRDQRLQLTMSFGIVAFSDVSSAYELLERAELTLGTAKDAGRNCVKVWQQN